MDGFRSGLFNCYLCINSTQQKKYNAKSDLIFDIDRDDVFALEISTASNILSLNMMVKHGQLMRTIP